MQHLYFVPDSVLESFKQGRRFGVTVVRDTWVGWNMMDGDKTEVNMVDFVNKT